MSKKFGKKNPGEGHNSNSFRMPEKPLDVEKSKKQINATNQSMVVACLELNGLKCMVVFKHTACVA